MKKFYLILVHETTAGYLMEPFILCGDGEGSTIQDETGHYAIYRGTPLKEFLKRKDITVIGDWEENWNE